MKPKNDYYATLGVLPSIDDVALTAVCRALLKKYHPDVAKGQNTDRRAADIIEAYRVLGDADQRKAYDSARRDVKSERRKQEDTWSANQADMWAASEENLWATREENLRAEREENQRSAKTRKQPGLLHSLVTMWLVSFAVRSLVTAGILAFFAMGPGGGMLVDVAKSLNALSTLGNVNFRLPLPFADAPNPSHNSVSQGVRGDSMQNKQVAVVKFGEPGYWSSEIRTMSMKVIHLVKSDSDASAGR
jgi:curved DNA-binding protein CbpA